MAIGVIPDPFLTKNEEEVQWVGEQIWNYRKSFTFPQDARHNPNVLKHLVFEGLDTYATVRLTGKQILKAENMFVTYRIDISDMTLNDQVPNLLEITFDNAEQKGDEEVAQHPGEHSV